MIFLIFSSERGSTKVEKSVGQNHIPEIITRKILFTAAELFSFK